MSTPKGCAWCGGDVDPNGWVYVGGREAPCCGDPKCESELAREDEAVRDEAAYEAAQDGYQRYY